MKRIGLLVLALLLMVGAANVLAQDDAPACDAAATADVLAGLVEAVRTAESPIEALGAVRDAASIALAACGGLNFSSDVEGMMPVIGPVEIPEGIYRVTVITDGYFIASFDVLDGQCGDGRLFLPGLFIVSAGDATEGAQAVVNSEGCETLISIENVTEDWSLSFEKLR